MQIFKVQLIKFHNSFRTSFSTVARNVLPTGGFQRLRLFFGRTNKGREWRLFCILSAYLKVGNLWSYFANCYFFLHTRSCCFFHSGSPLSPNLNFSGDVSSQIKLTIRKNSYEGLAVDWERKHKSY